MYQPPTAPLSIGGVLDDGFRLFKASFGKVIVLAIIGAFASNLPSFLLDGASPEEAAGTTTLMLSTGLAMLPISLVVFGAMLARIFAVVEGRPMSLGESIGIGLRKFFPLLLWFVLFALAVGVGLLLLVIPGLILLVSLGLGPYLIIKENQGPIEAIGNSHRLVWGYWWRTAILMTIILFIFAAVYALAGLLGVMGVLAETQGAGLGLLSFVSVVLVNAIINPIYYALWVSIFQDLALRKDGADLEQRMGDLETT